MTGYTPELVERLNEEADWLSGAELDGLRLSVGGAVNVMREAASGIAELTEALRGVMEIEEARLASGAFKPNAEAARRIQAGRDVLAKIGGNQTVRHERTPAPSAEPRLLPIVKHGTAGPIYEAPKPGDAVYIGQDGALYVAPAKIGGNHD